MDYNELSSTKARLLAAFSDRRNDFDYSIPTKRANKWGRDGFETTDVSSADT